MPIDDRASLYGVLDAGGDRDEEIVGTPESSWLDFKRDPYGLDDLADRLELAKDVSALANKSGGVIVIGVKAERETSQHDEVAAEIRPAPLGMLDADRVRKMVRQYVRPHLSPPLEIKRWERENAKSLMTIDVQNQDGSQRPFITDGGVDPAGKIRGNLFGYYLRDSDGVASVSADWIQGLLRDGERFREGTSLAPVPVTPPPFVTVESDLGSLEPQAIADLDREAASISEAPQMTVLAAPVVPDIDVSIFEPAFQAQFGRPPPLRPMGFNIDFAADRPEVTAEGGLRKVMPGVASLSVTSTGVTVLVLGPRYLQWGMERMQSKGDALSPWPLVEFISELCRFQADVVMASERADCNYRAILTGLRTDPPMSLPRGLPGPRRAPDFNPAQLPAERAEIDTGWRRHRDPSEAAFDLVKQIYHAFGLPPSDVPFKDPDLDRIVFEDITTYDAS